ncbi:MAG: hypothetical protein Q8Q42_02750 [Nanoarchaeota archaeon]|nr:hypothetical protein [Nanoarchaeota archaeon]
MENLKKDYSQLAEKYNLPSFQELDEEFEILYFRELFEISHPLSFVRRRIYEKFGWVCGMLQGIAQPNPSSMISIEESSFFSKEEKQKEHINLLKTMMYYERYSVSLDIETTEENDAEFIKQAYKKWIELKPMIKEISSKLKDGWKKDAGSKTRNNNYMG